MKSAPSPTTSFDEPKRHPRRLSVRVGALRGDRTALQYHSLPLSGLSSEQWRAIRDVGLFSPERPSVHDRTTPRVALGGTLSLVLSELRDSLDVYV
ncbi:MAG: hypothetical protein QOJ40_3137 [Verrucomicrobiota bacterium]